MTFTGNGSAAAANQEIEISAAVGLHNVVAVKLGIASFGGRLRRFPRCQSFLNFGVRNAQIKFPHGNVEIDHVAVLYDRKYAPSRSFRSDGQHYSSVSRATHPRV